ncbi:MAG: hypothetical protein GJ680_15760 [Alteromonadaceae bacterium]|nr:hypothetical protein [Alteromonadaceae bacterium]
MFSDSKYLIIAGVLSFIASALHIAIIFGGAKWYLFFGAGEAMAELAESGSHYPTIVTSGIAVILFIWGLYCLSGAGVILRLPLLRTVLVIVTFVYLSRGIAGLVLPWVTEHPAVTQNSIAFWMISSVICCFFGFIHLMGLIKKWRALGE